MTFQDQKGTLTLLENCLHIHVLPNGYDDDKVPQLQCGRNTSVVVCAQLYIDAAYLLIVSQLKQNYVHCRFI